MKHEQEEIRSAERRETYRNRSDESKVIYRVAGDISQQETELVKDQEFSKTKQERLRQRQRQVNNEQSDSK